MKNFDCSSIQRENAFVSTSLTSYDNSTILGTLLWIGRDDCATGTGTINNDLNMLRLGINEGDHVIGNFHDSESPSSLVEGRTRVKLPVPSPEIPCAVISYPSVRKP